jgi:hypothetical protein
MKSRQLAELLAQMSISSPVPRKVVEADESGGRYVDVIRNLDTTSSATTKKKKKNLPKLDKPNLNLNLNNYL